MRVIHLLLGMALVSLHANAQFFTNHPPAHWNGASEVLSLAVDTQGYLWMGTIDELYRFDGAEFKSAQDLVRGRGPSPTKVNDIEVRSDGSLWMLSEVTGLMRYDRTLQRFSTWQEMTGKPAPVITEYVSRMLWVGDTCLFVDGGKGVQLTVPDRGEWRDLGGPKDVQRFLVHDLTRDPHDPDRVWMGSRHGLYSWSIARQVFTHHPMPKAIDAGHRVSVRDLLWDGDALWMTTWGRGLVRYVPSTGAWRSSLLDKSSPVDQVENILLGIMDTADGRLFVGTQSGIGVFDKTSGALDLIAHDSEDNNSLMAGEVRGFHKDRSGIVWVALNSGLAQWDPAQNRFKRYAFRNRTFKAMDHARVHEVIDLGDSLLVSCSLCDGLMKVSVRTGVARTFPFLDRPGSNGEPIVVGQMVSMSDGKVLLCADPGVYVLDPVTMQLSVFDEALTKAGIGMSGFAVLNDGDERLWFAGNGLVSYELRTRRAVRYDKSQPGKERLPSTTWLQGLAHDSGGNIWVSQYDLGIGKLADGEGPVQLFSGERIAHTPGLKVWDVAVDASDRLWLGTMGKGLVVTPAADPGGPGTLLLSDSLGLPAMISSVSTDPTGEWVWAAGPGGLLRINAKSLQVDRFVAEDGLPGVDLHHVNVVQHSSGLVSIPMGLEGLIVTHVGELKAANVPAQIDIASVEVNGAPLHRARYTGTGSLELPHDSNYVLVRYNAPVLSRRHQTRLEYLLDGSRGGWTATEASAEVALPDLRPGSYTLRIRNAGGANGEETRLRFNIVPAVWQRTWFTALLVALAGALVYAYTRVRIKRVRLKEQERNAVELRVAESEMSALRAQMNPHFLFNSLNSINELIMLRDPREASEHLTKFARLMRAILNHSRSGLIPLSDELEALRMYIDLEALRFNGRFRSETSVQVTEKPERIMVPPLLLQPFVENAIWHGLLHKGEGDQCLKLRITDNQGILTYEVEDNGVGRGAAGQLKSLTATKRPSHGTRITEERMRLAERLFNMRIEVRYIDLYDLAQQPAGTKVVVNLNSNGTP